MSFNRPLNSGPCYVYLLIDPRDGTVFYIGTSWNPPIRAKQHYGDACSSAYATLREMRASGVEPILSISRPFETREQAETHEHNLIAIFPSVTNRDRRIS